MSDQPMFITRLSEEQATGYAGGTGPLAGLTFAIKDNLDLVGVPTTAGDPRRTTPAERTATGVQMLIDAGAVPVGKTNMDQYATGLVGTRSPFGACHSVYSPDHVSGGSSSGSAVAVATGEVDFALGTDTAGSGRVPAAFNGIVGLKPSRGLVSTTGLLPACRSLDCVTVFTRTVRLAREVLAVMGRYDAADPYSRELAQPPTPARPRVGVPRGGLSLDSLHTDAWHRAVAQARELYDVIDVDVTPFLEAAALLYDGPWVAERALAFGDAMDDDPAVDPTVRAIVCGGAGLSAVDAFAGLQRLAVLDRATRPTWGRVDALLLPVTPMHPMIADVTADPVGVNARLGTFTNMTNLLDLCGIAVPGPARGDGLPFGVQLLAPAGGDLLCLDLASAWCAEPVEAPTPAGAERAERVERVEIAVAGAHLTGQPLNPDLVARGGTLVRADRLAPDYRMYVIDGPLPRPGVTRLPHRVPAGDGLEIEIWSLPADAVAGFLGTIAPPLGLGKVELADGTEVIGFISSADGADPAQDITAYGGWRPWLASRHAQP